MRKKRGTGIDSAWRGSNGDGGLPCQMAGKGLYHEFKKTRRMARRNHEGEGTITRERIPMTEPRGGSDRPPLIEQAFQGLVGILLIIKIIYQTQ